MLMIYNEKEISQASHRAQAISSVLMRVEYGKKRD